MSLLAQKCVGVSQTQALVVAVGLNVNRELLRSCQLCDRNENENKPMMIRFPVGPDLLCSTVFHFS